MRHAIKINNWPRLWQTGLLAAVLALAVAGPVQNAQRSQLEAVSRGEIPPLSIRNNYFADPALQKESADA